MQKNKKIILSALLLSLLSVGVVIAWEILTINGTLTINEPITVTPTQSFTLTAYAGESKEESLTIHNAANVPIDVDFAVIFNDNGQGQGQTPQGMDVIASTTNGEIIPPQVGRLWCWTITVPAGSDKPLTLTFVIAQGAPPQPQGLSVEVRFNRE